MARSEHAGRLVRLEITTAAEFETDPATAVWKVVGCSSSDSFSLTNNTDVFRCKDSGSFEAETPTTQTAEVSTDTYFITDDASGVIDSGGIETMAKGQEVFYWRQLLSDGAESPTFTGLRWGKGFFKTFEPSYPLDGMATITASIGVQDWTIGDAPTA